MSGAPVDGAAGAPPRGRPAATGRLALREPADARSRDAVADELLPALRDHLHEHDREETALHVLDATAARVHDGEESVDRVTATALLDPLRPARADVLVEPEQQVGHARPGAAVGHVEVLALPGCGGPRG